MASPVDNLLGYNSGLYSSILDSYNKGASYLSAQLPAIYQGYQGLQGQVTNVLGQGGTPWGVAQPAATAIQDTFRQTAGNIDQQLINSGLGNTTVRSSMQNQNALQAGRAYAGLGSQLAQTYAGYLSNLGLAGLGAQQQGALAQSGLAAQQANTVASLAGRVQPNYGGGINYIPSSGGGGPRNNPGLPASVASLFGGGGNQGGMAGTMSGYPMGGGGGYGYAPSDTNPYLGQLSGLEGFDISMPDNSGYDMSGGGGDFGGGYSDSGGDF